MFRYGWYGWGSMTLLSGISPGYEPGPWAEQARSGEPRSLPVEIPLCRYAAGGEPAAVPSEQGRSFVTAWLFSTKLKIAAAPITSLRAPQGAAATVPAISNSKGTARPNFEPPARGPDNLPRAPFALLSLVWTDIAADDCCASHSLGTKTAAPPAIPLHHVPPTSSSFGTAWLIAALPQ